MELNKIINSDSIEAMKNMESECIDLLVTDPPYKTITGGNSNGKNSERPKGMLSGNRKLFTHQNIKISDWMPEVYRILKQGSHAYIFTNVLNLTEMLNESQKVGFKLHNLLVWEKQNCLGGTTQIFIKNKKVGLCYRSNIKDLFRNYNENNKSDWQICGEDGEFKDIKNVFFNGRQKCIKITFRNGQSISCTKNHKFLTSCGLKNAGELNVGDIIERNICININKDNTDTIFDYDLGFFVGLYLAEGNYEKCVVNRFVFTLSRDEDNNYGKLIRSISLKYGARYSKFTCNDSYCDRHYISSPILYGIIKEFISGDNSHNKHLKREVFNQNKEFMRGLLDGYLDGDGSKEMTGDESYRYRIGFTYNKELENDLRVLCDILGYKMTAKKAKTHGFNKEYTIIRGNIIKEYKEHHNCKNLGEIIKISNPFYQNVYDIEVEGNHLYSLVGGFITHNCTPSQYYMKNCEYVLFLRKGKAKWINDIGGSKTAHQFNNIIGNKTHPTEKPVDLLKFYIVNSSNESEIVFDPFSGTGSTLVAAKELNRRYLGYEIEKQYFDIAVNRLAGDINK